MIDEHTKNSYISFNSGKQEFLYLIYLLDLFFIYFLVIIDCFFFIY